MHYAQHAPKAPDGSALPDPNAPYGPMGEHVPGHPYVHDPVQANDFRARFHRPLVAPSPFRSSITVGGSGTQEGAPQPQQQQPPMSASAPPGGPPPPPAVNGADPGALAGQPGEQRPPTVPNGGPAIDPQLGQARDEAAGVAGKLERS